MVHHSNKEIKKHYDVDHGIRPEHEHPPEAGEGLDALQLEVGQVDEAEGCPEQRLGRLEQAAERDRQDQDTFWTSFGDTGPYSQERSAGCHQVNTMLRTSIVRVYKYRLSDL